MTRSVKCRRYGRGKPLILQHGFMSGSGYWTPFAAEVAHSFEVIAFDLPGYAGRGSEPALGSIEEVAGALVAELDKLGIGRFSLVGHSLGAMVSQQVALDYGDRLERLVLYGSAPEATGKERYETLDQTIERIKSAGLDEAAERITESWFVAGRRSPFFEFCRDAGRGTSLQAAVKTLRSSGVWDISDRLGEIRTPTLVICGDRDLSTRPERSIALFRGIPNAQLCIVPGCAHNVHLEKPSVFNKIVLDFLLAPEFSSEESARS